MGKEKFPKEIEDVDALDAELVSDGSGAENTDSDVDPEISEELAAAGLHIENEGEVEEI